MPDRFELYKHVLETWRFQVNSNWQRSSYFAAFETFALAGCWKLATDIPIAGAILSGLGSILTIAWWLNDQRTHFYARHWWESLLRLERDEGLEQQGLDFARQLDRIEKGLKYRYIMRMVPTIFLSAWLVVLGFGIANFQQHSDKSAAPPEGPHRRAYFDAHNHGYSAILPYYAYADLNAFIDNPNDPTKVDLEHRRELWKYLVSSRELRMEPVLTSPENRIAPGAIATARAYGKDISVLTAQQINGALQRVLTTTPWTEFDSAYAIRGGPVESFLSASFGHDLARMNKALCDASIMELAATDTAYSEQFVSFIGGWSLKTIAGRQTSSKLDTIRCFMKEPQVLAATGRLKGSLVPQIKVLLMTHTSELGATADGSHWMQFGTMGHCTESSQAPSLTVPDKIKFALLGRDSESQEIIEPSERAAFFSTVIGIDTAAPEITCFTSGASTENKGSGMENFKKLVRAVNYASRERRKNGWHGKLLVHTHVGEGSVTYRLDKIPEGENARNIFKSFPKIWIDQSTQQPVHVEQAGKNIKLIIAAVRELKSEIGDIDDYILFRFGHVTHADKDDARAMKELGIEADINLESNISTEAYYLAALWPKNNPPLTEPEQFDYNNLPAKLLNSGHAPELLAEHPLKYMLTARVRTLMGSDGGGEEDSDIAREYELAQKLIDYWRVHDDTFPHDLSVDTLYENAEEHLKDMREDRKSKGSSAVR